jgi:YVTN family beta-propeller protein
MRELEPGTIFAGHRIEESAGRGGMGVVYRAVHLDLSRTVALKVIAPGLIDDPGIQQRFVRESRLAASIEHPNVIPIHYVGEEDGTAYIAMRYVPGDDLRTRVRREGALPPARAAAIVAQIAAALDVAHAAGLVHRDVKPANVLLGAGDHVYLTDFGLTKELESSGATSTDRWVGTLDYVAPEQIRGERVDGRADVYSLGAVLFYTLTRRVPFPHASDEARLWAHLNAPPPSAAAMGAPVAFDAVIARAMAKAPADRYPSAGDLGRAAKSAVTGRSPAAVERTVAAGAAAPTTGGHATETATRRDPSDAPTRPAAVAARRRSPWPVVVGCIAGLLAGAGVAVQASRDGERERTATRPSPTPERSEPSGPRVVRSVRASRRPNSLALVGGRVWVGSSHTPRLTWIEEAGGDRLRRARPVQAGIRHLVGAAGKLWMTLPTEHRLVELDGRTARRSRPPIPLPGQPSALAADRDTVWVGLKATEVQPPLLASVDAETGATRATIPFSHEIHGLILARGALWLIRGAPSRLMRIDPASGAIERTISLPGENPAEIAYGAGALWVTVHDHGSVMRINPRTGATATIAVGVRPVGVAVHGTAVWVANLGSSTVTLVDGRSARVQAEIEVPLNPYAIAADSRGAWVTTLGTSRLVRIDGR